MISKSQIAPPIAVVKRMAITDRIRPDGLAVASLAVICLVAALPLWGRSTYLTGDSYQYLRAALTFAQGEGLRDMSGESFTVLTPLYSLLIGLGHLLFSNVNIETIARSISFAGAMIAVIAFYSLLRIRFSVWMSLMGASLFALMPLRVWMGLYALSEGLYVGLLLLSLAVFFRSKKRVWMLVLAGAFLGLAYLTRPEAILCFAGLVLFSVFQPGERPKKTLVFCAAFMIVGLSYHAWVYRETGTIRSSRFQILLAQSQAIHEGDLGSVFVFNQANADGTVESVLRPEMSFKAVAKRYFFYAQLEVQRLLHLVGPRLLVMALLLVGAAAFFWRAVRRRFGEFKMANAWPLLLVSWLFFLPLFHVEDRYLLQVAPAILFWLVVVGVGIREFIASRLSSRLKAIATAVPVAVFAAILLSYSYRLTTQLPRADESQLARGTAHWFEAQRLSPAATLAQTPDFAFFSNSRHVWMANGKPDDVIAYARRNGTQYVYVSSRDVPTALTEALLNDAAQKPASVKLLHEATDGAARSLLFQLN